MGCLYLMDCEGFTKIGVSTDPDGAGRLRTIQGANPFRVELIKDYALANARHVELTLHHMFKDKKERGEWFRLSNSDLDAIEGVVCGVGIPMSPGIVDMDLRSHAQKSNGKIDDLGLTLRRKNHGKSAYYIGYRQIKELGYVEVSEAVSA